MSPNPPVRRTRGTGPWDEAVGRARAVAVGDRALVSGTLPLLDGVLQGEGDPYQQARVAYGNALDALRELGLGVEHVVRTRTHLTHARDVDAVARAHREAFGAIRPAATVVVVSALVDSRALVEVEVEADAAAAPGGPA